MWASSPSSPRGAVVAPLMRAGGQRLEAVRQIQWPGHPHLLCQLIVRSSSFLSALVYLLRDMEYRTKAVAASRLGRQHLHCDAPAISCSLAWASLPSMPSRSSTASGLLFGSLHIAAHGGPRGGGEASGIAKCLVGIRQALTPPPSGTRPRNLGPPGLQELTRAPQRRRAPKLC